MLKCSEMPARDMPGKPLFFLVF